MKWKWIKRWLRLPDLTDDDLGPIKELSEAQRATREAQRKLHMTQLAGREVKAVSGVNVRLRKENNFSARMTEAWGRPKSG